MQRLIKIVMAILLCLSSSQIILAKDNETEKVPINENGANKCGDKAFFSYDEKTKTLTIVGEGATYDYDALNQIGWYANRSLIEKVVISDGITKIGKNLLSGLENVTSINFASSVKEISINALSNLKNLETIFIPSTITTIAGSNASQSPFSGCVDYLTIYTNATNKLNGWNNYFNYYNNNSALKVVYNTTVSQYEDVLNETIISFVGCGLSAGNNVYLDGVKFQLRSNLTLRVNKQYKIATTYKIVNENNVDIHTQYSTQMRVFKFTSSGTNKLQAVEMKNYANLLSYAGASIRITGKKGIRIITSINAKTRNNLINSNLDGYKVMEYGTLMAWASNLNGQEPLVGMKNVSKGRAYSRDDKINTSYKEANGIYQYTNTLVGNYSDQQCKSDVAMRSYMIIRPTSAKDNSQDIVIYGCTIYRSISYVALQNKNAFSVGTTGYEYIFKLIKAGYKDIYDKEYKGGNN